MLIKKIQNVMKKNGYEYVLVGTHYSNLVWAADDVGLANAHSLELANSCWQWGKVVSSYAKVGPQSLRNGWELLRDLLKLSMVSCVVVSKVAPTSEGSGF